MTNAVLATAIATGLMATMLGCSSGGGSGGCPQVSPCGGALTGTWAVSNACVSSSAQTPDGGCPGESEQIGSYTASGMVTFNSDMTYTSSITASVSATLNIPDSCLSSGGITFTCSDVQAQFSTTDAGTVSCNTSGSNCDCTLSETTHSNATGTYSVSGNTLTTIAATSGISTDSYCVQDRTLYLFPSGQSGNSQEIVLTKQ